MIRIDITENEANQRVDRFLRKYLKSTTLSDIYMMLRKKAVSVNGLKIKENYRLKVDDVLEINIESEERHTKKIKEAGRDFSSIYEDENLLIVDKPPGLILHPDVNHNGDTLVDQVLYYLYETGSYNPENELTFTPASVNRLDVNTGGIVLFAKNYVSLRHLNEVVRERYLKKYYICVVKGLIAEDRDIEAYILKDTKLNTASIFQDEVENSKAIHTYVRPLKTSEKYTLVEVELITGRSHQIRAQLSNIGNPIIGDVKYGDKNINKHFKDLYNLNGQLLYAYRVYFDKTLGSLKYLEGQSFTSSMPDMYKTIIKSIFNISMGEI